VRGVSKAVVRKASKVGRGERGNQCLTVYICIYVCVCVCVCVYVCVCVRVYLVNHSGFQVEHDAAGHMLAGTRLGEEGVESIITA
jgi:hypothetical protein